jgi:hypothetical protein
MYFMPSMLTCEAEYSRRSPPMADRLVGITASVAAAGWVVLRKQQQFLAIVLWIHFDNK